MYIEGLGSCSKSELAAIHVLGAGNLSLRAKNPATFVISVHLDL